ncbi:MAG: patatin-like phospholipase family protein [Proteobacteria bacterium]|nr:patatin-like phospholipase family protein [Pseudomonadota bacterium]
MALDEERASATLPVAADALRDCAALQPMDVPTLQALAAAAAHFSLPAGRVLFDAGSRPDGLYLVVGGRLGVQREPGTEWLSSIGRGELIGESGWLLGEPRSARIVALRDSELLWIEAEALHRIAGAAPTLALALARLCAHRLRRQHRQERRVAHAAIFTIVPNSVEVDIGSLATALASELGRFGRAELVWDARATSQPSAWFHAIEEANDYVVYVAHSHPSAWTRQCCRQADTLLLTAEAGAAVRPWPHVEHTGSDAAMARTELVLLHPETLRAGALQPWMGATRFDQHHHIVDADDIGRLARLISHRGVGLVLSGGGARGFAHLGAIRALREARVPLDAVGGASIGAIIAAGVASGWSDEEMRERYRRCFVDTNPVNDYTFPFVALARGRKVSRLLQGEFGEQRIEDLRTPFFCISANLSSGRATEHGAGMLWNALRASVAIPGVLPPVFSGEEVLVDGAAINNLPVDVMRRHQPGQVIGVDVGADRSFTADASQDEGPPFWKYFARLAGGKKRINIFQVLMRAGMINSATAAAEQRKLADLLLKPTLANIDLLNWKAFDRAVEAGYEHACRALETASLPRLPSVPQAPARANSLQRELERRLQNPHPRPAAQALKRPAS